MSQTQKPIRKDFNTQEEFEAAMTTWVNAQQPATTVPATTPAITANPATTAEGNAPLEVTVRRLSTTARGHARADGSSSTPVHSYMLVDGLTEAQLQACLMYGREGEFKDRIFYSPKLVGQVGKDTKAAIRMIPQQSGKNAGMNTLVFARSEQEIAQALQAEAQTTEFVQAANRFGVNRQSAGSIYLTQLAANMLGSQVQVTASQA